MELGCKSLDDCKKNRDNGKCILKACSLLFALKLKELIDITN